MGKTTKPFANRCHGLLASLCFLLAASCSQSPESAKVAAATPVAQPTAAKAMPDFGASEKVSTQATGYGPTLSAAVDDAIRNAIRQVNGQTVDASTETFQQAIAVSLDENVAQLSTAGFAQMVTTRSKGAITGFALISKQRQDDNSFEVNIQADVAKFKQPESAGLVRVVEAPFRVHAASMIVGSRRIDPNTIAASLHASVSDALNQTQRFTVLDREFNADIDSELNFIENGKVSNEDFSRIGQALATDLIFIGTLEQFDYIRHEQKLRTSDRLLVSFSGGAVLSYRLINITTRQVVLGDKVEIKLPTTEPSTLAAAIDENQIIESLSQQLSQRVSQALVTKFFPITIVALNGEDAVLSQGGKVVQVGKLYRVYQLGNEIKDPQSGRSLGRMESECCVIEVNRVTPDVAYGRLTEKKIALATPLTLGSLEVREEVALAAKPEGETEKSAPTQPKTGLASQSAAAKIPAQVKNDKAQPPQADKDW